MTGWEMLHERLSSGEKSAAEWLDEGGLTK